MPTYAVYDANGKILRSGMTSQPLPSTPGESVVYDIGSEADDSSHYIVNDTPVPLAAQPAVLDKTSIIADGVDAATLSGLPNPSTVTLLNDYTETIVTDGTLVFTADVPGKYRLKVDAFPYLDTEFTIDAT